MVKVTLYTNAFDTKGTIVELDYVLDFIKNGKLKNEIEAIRKSVDEDTQGHLKKKLPAFNPQGEFSKRAKNGFVIASGIAILDFDHCDGKKLKDKFSKNPCVIFAFISPRDGLKVGVRIPQVKNDFEYKAIYNRLLNHFNDEADGDPANKDISRLCFLSYDTDLYYNPNASVFPLKGSRDDFFFKCACSLKINKTKEEVYHILAGWNNQLSESFPESELKAKVDSAFKEEYSKKQYVVNRDRVLMTKEKFIALMKEQEESEIIENAEISEPEKILQDLKEYYFQKGKQKLARFLTAIYIMKTHNIITDYRSDKIKAYDKKKQYYRDMGEEIIKGLLTDIIQTNNTRNNSSEIIHLLRTKTYIEDELHLERAPYNFIPLQNGVYDLNTKQLLPNDPRYLFDLQIPINYDPNAKCPKIQNFISEIVSEKDESLIYDIFALILYRKNILEKFFIFTGEGQNGKSKLIDLLTFFAGSENSSAITLKQLTEDKFAVARTYKKLINVGADISGNAITDTSMLKSASASDRISGQFKFGQIFDFVPSATLVFSANKPPIFNDDSIGMFRRTERIGFTRTFGNEKDMAENPECKKADPQILDKLTTPEELSGLLNIAIKHLENILKKGQLSVVKSANELRVNYIKASNSVQAFCEDYCEEAEYIPADRIKGSKISGEEPIKIPAQGFLTVSELYKLYTNYCKENNLHIKTKDAFSKIMKKLSDWNLEFGQQDSKTGETCDKERSVRGIRLKDNIKICN